MKTKDVYIGYVADTPLGDVWVALTDAGLAALEFLTTESQFREELARRFSGTAILDNERTAEICSQIREFLNGERKAFDVDFDLNGFTLFQQTVLQKTFDIPFGEVRSYGQIAAAAGSPKAARAVGQVQRSNPIPLIIPCHRVVASDGSLHGYGGGSERLPVKEWLLKLEGAR